MPIAVLVTVVVLGFALYAGSQPDTSYWNGQATAASVLRAKHFDPSRSFRVISIEKSVSSKGSTTPTYIFQIDVGGSIQPFEISKLSVDWKFRPGPLNAKFRLDPKTLYRYHIGDGGPFEKCAGSGCSKGQEEIAGRLKDESPFDVLREFTRRLTVTISRADYARSVAPIIGG